MHKSITKSIIINRAIPGSGKTTISKKIKEKAESLSLSINIHSTDDYFMSTDGRYIFEKEKLEENHFKNQQAFEASLINNIDLVICDNTNLSSWESEFYTQCARQHDYQIILIDYLPRGIDEHVKSQQITPEKPDAHQIPKETLLDMFIGYYKNQKFLFKSYVAHAEIDVVYAFDKEDHSLKKTNQLIKHYDFDELFFVLSEQYLEAQRVIPELIMQKIFKEQEIEVSFEAKLAMWAELLKTNFKKATNYYLKNILSEIIQPRLDEKGLYTCNTLISVLGLNVESIVFMAAILKPQRLILLSGADLNPNGQLVKKFLIDKKILKEEQIQIKKIDFWNRKEVGDTIATYLISENDYFDFTNANKFVCIDATETCYKKNIKMCYLEGKYDITIKHIVPGSESIVFL